MFMPVLVYISMSMSMFMSMFAIITTFMSTFAFMSVFKFMFGQLDTPVRRGHRRFDPWRAGGVCSPWRMLWILGPGASASAEDWLQAKQEIRRARDGEKRKKKEVKVYRGRVGE